MNVEVRRASLFDVAECFALWQALVAEERLLCTGREDIAHTELTASSREEWAGRFAAVLALEGCALFLAVEKTLDKPVGYMLSSVASRDVGEPKVFLQVHELYVLPAFRGRQATYEARLALEAATTQWAKERNLRTVEITCVPAERQVQRWLARGFKLTSVRLVKDI